MKLLIKLRTPSELISYEGCALALTLATFGHDVQLYLEASTFALLMQPNSRLSGMIAALDLYDMPKAWLADNGFSDWLMGTTSKDVASQITLAPKTINTHQFEQVLTF